ncbi:MAG: ATP-binding protein [Gammaproteobacteria bacterium]|nr:MAG: ATP-binding protein [Gammaproteobacteria bacterium]
MPKNFIKKYSPTPDKIREIKALHVLGDVLHEPNLWHINRHSVSKAFLVGIFWCFIPVPMQMVAAAFCAIWINCNLPISVTLVWISNPVTMPPMFYFNYLVGAYILNRPTAEYDFQLSWQWLSDKLIEVGLPLYLGSLVVAVFFAVVSYGIIQFLWQRKVRTNWGKRHQQRGDIKKQS